MNLESLEDDNFKEFKGGTLQITQEIEINQNDQNLDNTDDNYPKLNNEVTNTNNSNISNLISLPNRLIGTLWNNRNNNSVATTEIVENTSSVSEDDAQSYFTFRDRVVETAILDCKNNLINPEEDEETIAAFLLTEVTSWDVEKERLILLTNKSMYSIKYDFIAMKKLEHRRILLSDLDSVVIGDLVYPPASLVPKLSGLVSGVTYVMKGHLLNLNSLQSSVKYFQARDRKTLGVRLLWNKGAPLAFSKKWNPFNNEVPYITFMSHPLHRHSECLTGNYRELVSNENFIEKLLNAISKQTPKKSECLIYHKEIVLNSYIGLGSFIHNKNSLGFFKVRGKFSF